MSEEKITPLAEIEAPWSRHISLSTVDHDSGLRMMRVRIKEGRARFTIIDLDERTAKELGGYLQAWAATGPASAGQDGDG